MGDPSPYSLSLKGCPDSTNNRACLFRMKCVTIKEIKRTNVLKKSIRFTRQIIIRPDENVSSVKGVRLVF